MRIPKIHDFRMSEIKEKKSKYDYTTIEVNLSPSEYVDDLGVFENDKELHRFVVRTKFYIRHSLEYQSLITFLKKKRGMYCCGVHNNITIWDKYPIEIHHTPFVMEDLIYIVINKRMKLNQSLRQSDIAEEIMKLHYLGLVGLYPLCATCHEYAHGESSDLFIPLDSIFGDPEEFVRIYNPYISSPIKQKFHSILELNKGYQFIESEIPEALVRKYVLVTQKGEEMMSTKRLVSFLDTLAKGNLEELLDSV